MGVGATRKQEQSERTRQGLVDAAAQLFAAKGFRDTSVQAIAEAAGISRGSIFWHFGSKEGLLLAVVEASLARFERQLERMREGRPMSLQESVYAFRDYIQHNPPIGRLFYALLFEAMGPRPELLPDFARLHERLRSYGTGWAERARAAGVLYDGIDPAAVGVIITAVLTGINLQWQVDPSGFDLAETTATLARLLERGLSADTPA
jgi:TetR/AcrR family acrAB operon transcriptional repressor